MRLLELTPNGLECQRGEFTIDPNRRVPLAVITHAHSDHARRGCGEYICTPSCAPLLRHRLGKIKIREVPFGERFTLNGVTLSFHPAGHVLGSAQVRVEHEDEVWVVSGDYKREDDPTCEPFEVVPCDVFVTEATFANPQYNWEESTTVIADIVQWHKRNVSQGKSSVLRCYSLGKAQRLIALLHPHVGELTVHPTIEAFRAHYAAGNIELPPTRVFGANSTRITLALLPHRTSHEEILDVLGAYEEANVSGWMQAGASPWAQGSGFALSDHADWQGILRTIQECGAREVLVTHGSTRHLIRELRKSGIRATPLVSAKRSPQQMLASWL